MILKYNEETERYNDFHCGESFKIKVNDKIEIVEKGIYQQAKKIKKKVKK